MYRALSEIKNWLYDTGRMELVDVGVPVVSIGNLRVGGVGKTPFTELILRSLGRRRKIAVVSRNYKAAVKEAAAVEPERPDAGAFFGDEPTLLARAFPEVTVYVGPRKYETAGYAALTKPDLILVDDGFQHRKLRRDLDCVVLDPADFSARVLPFGPLREALGHAGRADWAIVNGVKPGEDPNFWRRKFPAEVGELLEIAGVNGKLAIDVTGVDPIAAFAGIARPHRFREALEKEVGRKLAGWWEFKNHENYDDAKLAPLERWLRENPRGVLVTTRKDAVKLDVWMKKNERVRAADWRLDFVFGGELIDVLDRLVEAHRK